MYVIIRAENNKKGDKFVEDLRKLLKNHKKTAEINTIYSDKEYENGMDDLI